MRLHVVFLLLFLAALAFLIIIRSSIREMFSLQLFKEDWEGYRLGDCIRHYPLIGEGAYKEVSDFQAIKEKLPNSLCGRILNDPEYLSPNFDVKAHVANQLKDKPKTDTNYIGVHIRLGDILHGKDPFYFRDLPYYEKELKKLQSSGVKKAFIVAGSHLNKNLEESKKLLSDLEKITKELGYEVEVVSGTPDEDFERLVKGKHFVQGGGGFSIAVEKMRKYMKK